jgi:hypothetical protein
MVEEKWLKILEGPATITLGVRFLAGMESWILQVSFTSFPYLLQTVLRSRSPSRYQRLKRNFI